MGKRFAAAAALAALIWAASAPAAAQEAPEQRGDITVVMTGFKSDAGDARVALVKDKASFDSEDAAPFRGAVAKISGGRAEHTFREIPYGSYAVKFFHDEDGSGKLRTGAFGIPKEEYGFSGGARSKNFEKARFELAAPRLNLTIEAR